MKVIGVFIICLSLFTFNSVWAVPAFPGAEGFGANSVGGRGGQVIEVTNLNDSGPGSLRAAVQTRGPRIVVFRVSGNIELRSQLLIENPYITIAGQSAPGDGICLKNYGLRVEAGDVIIRYLRIRPGDNEKVPLDSVSISRGRNIILDHCSASWSVDETLSATSRRNRLGDVTVQWCMITESLNCSVHVKDCHGYGSLIRGGRGNGYTYHHNLYAHHKGRSPRPGNYEDYKRDPEGLIFDFRNNVVYNWGGSHAGYNADKDSITKMNFVNNYYKQGPDSTNGIAFEDKCVYNKAYFSGNWMNGNCPEDPWSLVKFVDFTEERKKAYKQSFPVGPVGPVLFGLVNTDDTETAYALVLADAGASFPVRDTVDTRVVNDLIKGTGRIIDDEQEVGGWPELRSATPPVDTDHDGMPDEWELALCLDPNDKSDSTADRDGDSYTNIEEYLNWLPQKPPMPTRPGIK